MKKIIIAAIALTITASAVWAGCGTKCWTDFNGTRRCQYTCE